MLAVPQRAEKSGRSRRARTDRHLLLLERTRRPRSVLGPYRIGAPGLRSHSQAKEDRRPTRTPRRLCSIYACQHRVAGHGNLQGQRNGSGQSPDGPERPDLCPDWRRGAPGGTDMGGASAGRQPGPGRDHRNRGPQQAPVRYLGLGGERPGRSGGQVRVLRLACVPVQRSRLRRPGVCQSRSYRR